MASTTSVIVSGSFATVPWIIGAFVLIQGIDQFLFEPLILAKNVSLHPLTVVLVLIIGGKFFGLIGLLLAVPATAILKVILREVVINARSYHLTPEDSLQRAELA